MCDYCHENIAKTAKQRDELIRENRELRARVKVLREQNARLSEQKRALMNRIMNDKLRRDREDRLREKANAGYLEVRASGILWIKE